LLTDRQTDRQTDNDENNLLGGVNQHWQKQQWYTRRQNVCRSPTLNKA